MRRIDDLQTHGLKFIQDDALFPYGCDAVELANFAAPRAGTRVCDLGAGTGILSVLLAGKYGCTVTAVEIQEACCAVLRENAARNGLPIETVHMRMQDFRGQFDAVICNPPYAKEGSGAPRANESERLACFEVEVTLPEVIECAARLLSTGGKFWIVHRADRLAELMCALARRRLEPKRMQLLRPTSDKPPHLVMLECKRDARAGLAVLPEKILSQTK